MRTSEVLDKAADLLEEMGWCQQVEENSEGALCALGALYRAAPLIQDPYFQPAGALDAFRRFLIRECADVWGHIPDWNDHPSRTATEVIDALRHAAKLEKEVEDAGI